MNSNEQREGAVVVGVALGGLFSMHESQSRSRWRLMRGISGLLRRLSIRKNNKTVWFDLIWFDVIWLRLAACRWMWSPEYKARRWKADIYYYTHTPCSSHVLHTISTADTETIYCKIHLINHKAHHKISYYNTAHSWERVLSLSFSLSFMSVNHSLINVALQTSHQLFKTRFCFLEQVQKLQHLTFSLGRNHVCMSCSINSKTSIQQQISPNSHFVFSLSAN